MSFSFRPADNNFAFSGELIGAISNDTVRVKVPKATPLNNLVPHISFKGQTISPSDKKPADFSTPLRFIITAEDGSTKSFIVIVSYMATDKSILSFSFLTSANSISENVIGLVGNDTVILNAPPGTNLNMLVPTITFTGKSISPSNNAAQNFSAPIQYDVTAEDGSHKLYTVIVSPNKTVYIGSNDGYLYALNAATGKPEWKFNVGGPVSSATYANGVVFVGAFERQFYALDATTGALKWKFYDFAGAFSTPTVYNGKVYVSLTGSSYWGRDVYAFDVLSGRLVWKKTISAGGYGSISSPTVANGTVYISEFNSGLTGLNAETGDVKWGVRNIGIAVSNPAVVNGVVYVGSESNVLAAFDAANGAMLWKYMDKLSEHVYTPGYTSPTIVNGVAYVGGYQTMYAINISNGSLKWKYKSLGGVAQIGTNTRPVAGLFSSPVVYHGLVYAGNDDYLLYSINAETGVLGWRYENALQVRNSAPAPTVANGVLYVNRDDEKLYAFDAVNGSLKWTFAAGGLIKADPCVVDNKANIFYSGNSGDLN